jgi:ketosteroid isomerase-like protein
MIMETSGQAFYNRQVALLEARDIDGLIATQYAPDAQVIGFDFAVKGQDALRKHFEGYLARLGNLQVVSTDRFAETEDTIFFEATVRITGGEARVYDAFVLHDGKATHHFTGLLGFTPG